MTEEALAEYQAKGVVRRHVMGGSQPEKKKNKYGNRRFKNEEGSWDSEKEYRRWQELKLLERAGKIQDLQKKVAFELIPAAMRDHKRLRPIQYIADFVYTEAGKTVVEDAKGYRNKLYMLKKRLMWDRHQIEVFES